MLELKTPVSLRKAVPNDFTLRIHPPGVGTSLEWENDHIFVKVGAVNTGHAYTLVEDNLKATFSLGLHLHRHHAETFYILEGNLEFFIDGDWMPATPGTCIHIPPGVPHACKVSDSSRSAKMLMIFQPSGFDQFLAELAKLGPEDFSNEDTLATLREKYDIVQLGSRPDRIDREV